MQIRPEVLPFLIASIVAGMIIAAICALCGRAPVATLSAGALVAIILGGYMLYFFRDPARIPPDDPGAIIAAADGKIARLTTLEPQAFRKAVTRSGLTEEDIALFGSGNVIRISIFLSLVDVHVNRAPLEGTARFLGYFPGKRLFTFDEKSSDENQHNAILIQNEKTPCLITQIVGPVCRRVVYWLDHDQPHIITQGQSFGMMKFGSRLDMYFPENLITLECRLNDTVKAGETIIARINN